MKRYLFIVFLFFQLSSSIGAELDSSYQAINYDSLEHRGFRLSREGFMDLYCTNDTLCRLIDYYFYRRDNAFNSKAARFLQGITINSYVLSGYYTYPDEALFAAVVVTIVMAVPSIVIIGAPIIKYSRINLRNQILDYYQGNNISPRLMKKLYKQ